MPYVGVRTVLSAAGLLKHQEKFVTTLGVETAHDLNELQEADLAQIGLGARYVKLREELDRILVRKQERGVAGAGLTGASSSMRATNGRSGAQKSVENRYQQRRRTDGCGIELVDLAVDGT